MLDMAALMVYVSGIPNVEYTSTEPLRREKAVRMHHSCMPRSSSIFHICSPFLATASRYIVEVRRKIAVQMACFAATLAIGAVFTVTKSPSGAS